MKFKLIVLTALFSIASMALIAQKKQYRVRDLNLVYDSARFARETGFQIGKNKVVNHKGTTTIIIDEAANTITGHIGFYCTECSAGFVDKTINLNINKISEGNYRVTDFHDKFLGKCSTCTVIVNETSREITFDFLYFFLMEQKTVFHMAPAYVNINATIAAFDYEALGELVEKGVDLNAPYEFNGKNETPLNFLCDLDPWKSEKEDVMAKILLDKGVNVNIADDKGFTPLMKTLQHVNVTLFSMINQHNPDRNAKAKDGTTALKLAKTLVKKAENYTSQKYAFEAIANSLKN